MTGLPEIIPGHKSGSRTSPLVSSNPVCGQRSVTGRVRVCVSVLRGGGSERGGLGHTVADFALLGAEGGWVAAEEPEQILHQKGPGRRVFAQLLKRYKQPPRRG